MSRNNKYIIISILLALSAASAHAQWTSRPSFSNMLEHYEYCGGTFCLCSNAVFVASADGEFQTITKSTGLSSSYISCGAAQTSSRTLAVGYEDGSIDIFRNGRKSFLKNVSLTNNQISSPIRHITFCNTAMLCSGDFGVSLLDADRAEVLACCHLPFPVYKCSTDGSTIYAHTSGGTFSIDIHNSNFQDPERWIPLSPSNIGSADPISAGVPSYNLGVADPMYTGWPPNSSGKADPEKYDGPTPQSLPSDDVAAMYSMDGRLMIAGSHCSQLSKNSLSYFQNPDGVDFTAVFCNPYNSAHVFLGDANGTLFEYLDNKLKARYSGKMKGRVVGMDCTPEGDLFILHHDIYNPVSVFDHNGNWHTATSFSGIRCNKPSQIIKLSDYVFAVCAAEQGIFVVDLAGSSLNFSDDTFAMVYPMQGSAKIGTEVTCLATDVDGRLWAGTNKGMAYCSNPRGIVDGSTGFVRPVIEEPLDGNDSYAQYLLSQKCVTGIAVDVAGRKWISTRDAGVFLVEADCSHEVLRLNERNSPLPSDTVFAINIVQRTGEVFFATRNGVASYLSDVQEASVDLSDVLVFPNPVRPEYTGSVYVQGLEDGCDVRFTDVAGNLVYKCESVGGRVEWDGNNLNGRRCASGVYLVWVINVHTGHRVVKKLLFMR